jgi:hypothetical protein
MLSGFEAVRSRVGEFVASGRASRPGGAAHNLPGALAPGRGAREDPWHA